ncbi:solute carrier family 22 member 20-like isoform X2 [Ascaphus truei]|uniref:solute carrier family 22 member 20-like isoform X2 n=1 Tax=Ascaphus truei TaxID=8439 RepID=UPI003F59775B
MGFNDLLQSIGGLGCFQVLHTSMLLLPMCFMACHNFLQNFTAAIPAHRCRLPWLYNQTMTYDRGLLLASVPLDGNQKPESCQRYTEAQSAVWSLNSTLYNNTEPCKDGWVYDKSVFSSTIVTEWDLVCDLHRMRQMAQSIYMAGLLVGALLLGGLSDRFVPESARWLILRGRSREALKYLQRVARINGKREVGVKLSEEVLISHMQSEMKHVKSSQSPVELFRTPGMRRVTICLLLVWFSTSFGFYGVGMDLQKFKSSIFLLQFFFGAIDIPAKLISAMSMSYIGRRVTQSASLILSGLTLLANMFVPQDMIILRIALAALGKGCLASSFACAYLYSGELFPTVVRQTGMGVVTMNARVGSMVAPLVLMLWEVSTILPPVIYGLSGILSGSAALFLTETRNRQLPDTVGQVETRSKSKGFPRNTPNEEVALTKREPTSPQNHLLDTL